VSRAFFVPHGITVEVDAAQGMSPGGVRSHRHWARAMAPGAGCL